MALGAEAADDAVEESVTVSVFGRGPKRRERGYKRKFGEPNKMRLYGKIDTIILSNAANKLRVPSTPVAQLEILMARLLPRREEPGVVEDGVARHATVKRLQIMHGQALRFEIQLGEKIGFVCEVFDDFLRLNWRVGAGVDWKHL